MESPEPLEESVLTCEDRGQSRPLCRGEVGQAAGARAPRSWGLGDEEEPPGRGLRQRQQGWGRIELEPHVHDSCPWRHHGPRRAALSMSHRGDGQAGRSQRLWGRWGGVVFRGGLQKLTLPGAGWVRSPRPLPIWTLERGPPDPLGCNCRQHATCRRRSGRGPFSSSSRWRVLPSLVVVAAVERPEAATLGSYPAFRSLTWKRAVLYHRLGPSILSHALRARPGLRARWPIQSGARPRAPPRACEPAFEGRVLCRQRPSS